MYVCIYVFIYLCMYILGKVRVTYRFKRSSGMLIRIDLVVTYRRFGPTLIGQTDCMNIEDEDETNILSRNVGN
jgi:hypothetical protein